MLFFNKNSLYRLSFLFYFILKKKRLGFKKVQWKLSSFFHMNRIKYFFYFLKKTFLYKKYFFFFFISKMLFVLFNNIKQIISFLFINSTFLNFTKFPETIIKGSIFNTFFGINNVPNRKVFDYSFLFNVNYFSLFLKMFILMYKHLNISYFSIPLKRNKFTVLRSPHIDKKSREQFELKHFNVVLNELTLFSAGINPFFLNFLSFFIDSFKLEEKVEILATNHI